MTSVTWRERKMKRLLCRICAALQRQAVDRPLEGACLAPSCNTWPKQGLCHNMAGKTFPCRARITRVCCHLTLTHGIWRLDTLPCPDASTHFTLDVAFREELFSSMNAMSLYLNYILWKPRHLIFSNKSCWNFYLSFRKLSWECFAHLQSDAVWKIFSIFIHTRKRDTAFLNRCFGRLALRKEPARLAPVVSKLVSGGTYEYVWALHGSPKQNF